MSATLPGRRLARALTRVAADAGVPIVIERHDETAWASATFAGARHCLEASAASGEPLARWLAGLDGAALDVPGHLVADLHVHTAAAAGAITRFRVDGVTVAAS